MDEIFVLFEKWCKKLRVVPSWDVKLSLWTTRVKYTGDSKIDCDDRKAIVLLNKVNPKQENLEEVLVHELMHLKLYPLDQVTESLISANYKEESPESHFAYTQFSRLWSRRSRS